jgi:hypothetical protein
MATKSTKSSKTPKDIQLTVGLPGWKAKSGSEECSGHLTIKLTYKDKGSFRSVDLKKSKGKLLTLSIVGDVNFGFRRGSAGGQCISTVREIWGHIPEIAELCDLWERWHLNDLVAGTRKQMEAIRGMEKGPNLDWYTWACAQLALRDLLVDREYTFGHEWLYEPLPAKVVARIKALAKEI